MAKTSTRPADKFKKVFVYVSIGAFGFAMIGSTARMFLNANSPPVNPVPSEESGQQRLEQNVEGYQSILTREPNNKTALEGLLLAQIQLRRLPEAIATLEKLVEVSPEVPQYKEQLEALKQEQLRQEQEAASNGETDGSGNEDATVEDDSPIAPE